MKTLVLSEVKRRLLSSISILVIFVLLAAIALDMNEANKLRASRPFEGHNMYNWQGMTYDWLVLIPEKRKEAYPKAVHSFNLFSEQYNNMGRAGLEGDFLEFSRVSSFNYLLFYKMRSLTEHPLSEYTTKADIGYIWEEVSGGIEYDDIDFRPLANPDSSFREAWLLYAKYFHYLYKNQIEPVYIDENNNISTTYRYVFGIIPIALILSAILFNYNSINRDKRSGVLKLILTQSVERSRFYISKWLGGVIHLVTTMIIPLLLMGLFLGLRNGFVTLKYPLTYLGGTTTHLRPITNFFDTSINQVKPIIHPRAIGHAAVKAPLNNQAYIHADVEIIPFYQYILIAIILIILFAGFAVALIQLISAIVNNEIISLGVNVIVIILGAVISMPLTLGERLNLSPFTMFNISRIIEGTYNVTVLTSIILLAFTTILLLTVGCLYFKKKPI